MKQQFLDADIQRACERALAHIASEQKENGSFSSETVFYTGLILNALESIDGVQAAGIKEKGSVFLLSEKGADWSYNYWQRNSHSYVAKPYPDDLDDTFVALAAIQSCDKDTLTERAWKAITDLLIQNEISPGGPYRTWLVQDGNCLDRQWDDVDVVVNSNIASFLLQCNIRLPKLQEYFDSLISERKLASRYYHDIHAIVYFLSKAYKGKHRKTLKQILFEKRLENDCWQSPLATAFSISALLALGENPATLVPPVEYLLASQQNSRWPEEALFIESKNKRGTIYSSCSAYVSACCVEALQAYRTAIQKSSGRNRYSEEKVFIDSVFNDCEKLFSNSALLPQFRAAIASMRSKDPHSEIAALPHKFKKNMILRIGTIPDAKNLAVATVLGWVGYSIIDKAVDGEDILGQLPLAVKCIREMHTLFQLAGNSDLIVQKILNGIEETVSWEYEHCKVMKNDHGFLIIPATLPAYGNYDCLAEKSLGCALGPIIMCLLSGQYDQAALIEQFFRQYLIARQMNDDAHDWLLDLEHGFLNSVSIDIVVDWQNNWKKSFLDIQAEKYSLQTLFWEKHIDTVSKRIISACQAARDAMDNVTILTNTDFLLQLLLPLEQSALRAVTERDKTKCFIYTCSMTTQKDDEINTDAEYEPVETLDEILDKDGNPLDAIEQNQDEASFENDDGSQAQLRRAIEGDQENKNDE